MKKFIIIPGIALLTALLAVPAFADNRDWAGRGQSMKGRWQEGPGPYEQNFRRLDNLTEEQKEQIEKIRQDHFDKTAGLRAQLIAKRAELDILLNTSNPDLDTAKTLQKELSDLQAKMDQDRIILLLELRKIDPNFRMGMSRGPSRNPQFMSRGPGRNPQFMGRGPGMGQQRYMDRFGPNIYQ